MTTRIWDGTDGADWFAASNWTPLGVPADGDTVLIYAPGPKLAHDDPPMAGAYALTVGSVAFQSPASLTAVGYSLPAGFAINVSDAAPFASLNLDAAYSQDGTLLADTTLDGQIDVSNALLNVTVGGSGSTAPELQGDGTTTIGRGAMVSFTGSVAASQTVAFADANATLLLNDPSSFAATITGFTAGDRIELGHLDVATSVTYDAATETLDVFQQDGTQIGSLHLQETGGPLNFYVAPFGHGGSIITTSDAVRLWAGGTQDWYSAAGWLNGVPLGGDTATIGSGTVQISAADVATYGALDIETIMLGAPAGNAPVTLESDGATFGEGLTIITAGQPSYAPPYIAPTAAFQANGVTLFEGVIRDQAEGGTLTITVGTGGEFVMVGSPTTVPEDSGNLATIVVSQESRLDIQGGMVTDNGLVLVDGVAQFAADVTLQGYGTVQIEGSGHVIVDGAVSADDDGRPNFQFTDNQGTLTLSNLPAFQGLVQMAQAGDRIDLTNIAATSIVYQPDTFTGPTGLAYGTLTLTDQNGATLGQILVSDPNSNGVTWNDFTLSSDGHGGSLVTYAPAGPVTLREALPVAAVGTTGQAISFATLLTEAFGAVPADFTSYTLSGQQALSDDDAYWNQPPGGTPANSYWLLDGQVVTSDTTISAADIADAQFVAGNNIVTSAYFSVPTATDGSGAVSEYTQYNIWTVDPAAAAPNAGSGAPDPSDIVASADLYNTVYDQPYNTDDCNSISDDVTAAAGAVQPFMNFGTDPSQNQEGGFWRIAYRASDFPTPVADWFTLVQPGDVVRMGRISQSGEHTTTILGTVNADGSITVYDNGDHNGDGAQVIGVHDATYWTGTDPNTITIYRLDPAHQYLITGTDQGETIQGSVFNNLIRPGGGDDTITAGSGTNEIQGTAAQLNGDSIVDFHPGDSIDATDLALAGATFTYQAATGMLTLDNAGSGVSLSVALPAGLAQDFSLTADEGGDGTLLTLACFATGTRLATPDGPVAVEDLRVGDRLRTTGAPATPSRRVVWIGRRQIDLRRHPKAAALQPVRIAPHAFGPDMPSRPVLLSPDHAVFVDGVLIPVRHLVDGQGIRVLRRPGITYWHVELDRHDVVLAEGLPVESFLDTGQRACFAGQGVVQLLWPDFSALVWEAQGCAPLVVTGPALDAVRTRLAAAANARRHVA